MITRIATVAALCCPLMAGTCSGWDFRYRGRCRAGGRSGCRRTGRAA